MAEHKIETTHSQVGQVWDWPLQHNDGVVKVTNTDDLFEVGLDVQFFTPKELDVKICGEELVIYGRHEMREDSLGSVAREVHRAYHLPSDVDKTQLKSHLNDRGVLQISAPKKKKNV